jgi:hypothetical protein
VRYFLNRHDSVSSYPKHVERKYQKHVTQTQNKIYYQLASKVLADNIHKDVKDWTIVLKDEIQKHEINDPELVYDAIKEIMLKPSKNKPIFKFKSQLHYLTAISTGIVSVQLSLFSLCAVAPLIIYTEAIITNITAFSFLSIFICLPLSYVTFCGALYYTPIFYGYSLIQYEEYKKTNYIIDKNITKLKSFIDERESKLLIDKTSISYLTQNHCKE